MNIVRPLLVLVPALLLFAGCAAKNPLRIVVPPPPEQPRYEYMGNFSNDYDLKKSRYGEAGKVLFGEMQPPVLRMPIDVVVDGKGKAYVSDANLRAVVIFDMNSGALDVLDVSGTPFGLAVDNSGLLYVAMGADGKINVFDPKSQGSLKRLIGKDVLGHAAELLIREDLGRIYVADTKEHKIVVFDLDGNLLFEFGSVGDDPGEFFGPQGLAFDREGRLFVCDMFNARIQVFEPDGTFLYLFGERGSNVNQMENPRDIAFDSDNNLYVVEGRRSTVAVFDVEGTLKMVLGEGRPINHPLGFASPRGLFIDANDRIYVAELLNRRITMWQYLSADYLSRHPMTAEDVAAQKAAVQRSQELLEKAKKD